jgi:hypothetical protein
MGCGRERGRRSERAHEGGTACQRPSRRDSLDYVIVFNDRRLLRLLKGFFDDYYHPARCH